MRIWQRIVVKTLQQYWRHSRGLRLSVQAVVVENGNRVLLVRTPGTPGWQLPAATVENGEGVEDTLARLLREVADGEATAPTLTRLHCDPASSPDHHVAIFLVGSWQRSAAADPEQEASDLRFFARDALPAHMPAADRAHVTEALQTATE